MENTEIGLMSVSSTPHVRGTDTVQRLMRDVLIALAPAAVMGAYYYGLNAVITMFLAVGAAVLAEYLYKRGTKQEITINDFSAAITGLLLAFNLPPTSPFWMPIVGSFFAIIVVKQLFGGLGQNFINPALAARAVLLASFPQQMNDWVVDGVSGATLLTRIKESSEAFVPQTSDYMSLLFGKIGGCIGETCAVALLAGGIYLIVRKVITWHTPVAYIGSFIIFTIIFGRNGIFTSDIIFEVLAGGLLLGAFFMATDYSSAPITHKGKLIMGVGCGLLTVLIRVYGGYPEGVSYSILIMNICVPLIDKYVRPRVYGTGKIKKGV